MLTLIALGRLREPFYRDAAAEYEKRMRAFGGIRMVELPEVRLPDDPSPAQIQNALQRETASVQAHLPKNAWLCVLTPEGKLISSEVLADTLRRVRLSGKSELVFLIGSSYGLDPAIKKQADLLLSMSPMTFPHHLARVMVLEQLYRAENILIGTKYHK